MVSTPRDAPGQGASLTSSDARSAALLAAALAYAARGWAVFPLHNLTTGGHCTCSAGGRCKSTAKHPRTSNGVSDATLDERQIRAWWRRWPLANIGVNMGRSGLLALDVDPRHGGDESLPQLVSDHAPAEDELASTLIAETGGGGEHYVFRVSEERPGPAGPNKKSLLLTYPGLDTRAANSYIVVAPSLHSSGAFYQWRNPDIAPTLLPAWLDTVMRTDAPRQSRDDQAAREMLAALTTSHTPAYWLDRALAQSQEGNRDLTCFWLACQLRDDGVGEAEARGLCEQYAARVGGAEPYDAYEARKCVKNAFSRERREPARSQSGKASKSTKPAPARLGGPSGGARPAGRLIDFPQASEALATAEGDTGGDGGGTSDDDLLRFSADDNGNAEAMFLLYGHEFLYTPAYGWMQWSETHWRAVPDAIVVRYVIATLKRRRHAAVERGNEPVVKTTACNNSRVNGCFALFKSYVIEPSVEVFDSDPNTINCQNGVLNLQTGALTPHDSSQRFSYCAPVPYDSLADKSRWEEFILAAVGDNQELARYLQTCAGYSLTGHTKDEKVFYLYGPTRAGKGTFTETLLALLPKPLSTEVDFATFTAPRDVDAQNFDLAALKPARVVIASESNRHQKLNPAKVKQLSGGNLIRCAFKHKDMFEYRPQFSMWLVSNNPVNADADDEALWGRLHVIGFPHSRLGEEDTKLKERMKGVDNLRGVLRWAVEGAQRWYQEGQLSPPRAVADATSDQRNAQDYIKQWIEDWCVLDSAKWTSSAQLLKSYQVWCESNSVKPLRSNDFSDTLVRRFRCVAARHGKAGTRGYFGIAIDDRRTE